jgi:hypothetical protein
MNFYFLPWVYVLHRVCVCPNFVQYLLLHSVLIPRLERMFCIICLYISCNPMHFIWCSSLSVFFALSCYCMNVLPNTGFCVCPHCILSYFYCPNVISYYASCFDVSRPKYMSVPCSAALMCCLATGCSQQHLL